MKKLLFLRFYDRIIKAGENLMRCRYCGEKTERLFDVAHQECHDKYLTHSNALLKICKEYESGNIEHKAAVNSLVELCQDKNYCYKSLDIDIDNFADIMHKGDCPIFFTNCSSIVEEKNTCRTESIGWGETRPSWKVTKKNYHIVAKYSLPIRTYT